AAVGWLQQRREMLFGPDPTAGPRFFRVWDKLADLIYSTTENHDPKHNQDDIVSTALSEPAGKMVWGLYDSLVARNPTCGCGLSSEFGPRFNSAVEAPGRPGLLARVFLTQYLAYLHWVDAAWTSEKLVPHLAWTNPDAVALWQARAYGNIGLAGLFN